ncbi:hypothetical protein J2Z21_008342 [Streptomyces griseochromogenes]|uniref:Uncharacterized protein n=1 Tax=Streptomyces griseochromogenes TaxID=68214 RepID=A0ABS4M6P7_9ACTN|nr:hypothetical protein [Streptomyces griseochromogenes]MBP2055328.1 hypothetical protein [Streptomyces griseochromogenes]
MLGNGTTPSPCAASTVLITRRRISRDRVPVEMFVSLSSTSRIAATSRASARPVASHRRVVR